ncbi:Late embryogenesis abundant (LEA)hydroxyproline-rich glycoprotein family [Zostera marina]|uniref:Late embryogenesis abundant (LEA)hydroxyproline-rich glycoprotein family n=1 Tax=Zostera marina TaxID=29655 RepID=A0A0K9PHY0_ZOSMR|nr:Late embryogenesis abundant (LEA)hydroxyproline-rich glycoprotein family [Zostera marina]
MKKLALGKERRTNPLVWLAAVICAILAIAVIITGILVFAFYMAYQPKVPYIFINSAQLLRLQYDKTGLLRTQMAMVLVADNDNVRARASFSNLDLVLRFHSLPLANLRADPFLVGKNSSNRLDYDVGSAVIPLDKDGMREVDLSLKRDRIFFVLQGKVRIKWTVGNLVRVKIWSRLDCQVQFFPSNGSSIGLDCSSKSD